jgi:hypothetical protein
MLNLSCVVSGDLMNFHIVTSEGDNRSYHTFCIPLIHIRPMKNILLDIQMNSKGSEFSNDYYSYSPNYGLGFEPKKNDDSSHHAFIFKNEDDILKVLNLLTSNLPE